MDEPDIPTLPHNPNIFKLEEKQKHVLCHEIGAGSACTKCSCPGLDLHFWRKMCKTCGCRMDEHDVVLPQFDHGQIVIGRLFGTREIFEARPQHGSLSRHGLRSTGRLVNGDFVKGPGEQVWEKSPMRREMEETSRLPTAQYNYKVETPRKGETVVTEYAWAPVNDPSLVSRYMSALPEADRPVVGTQGEQNRRQKLAYQLPLYDCNIDDARFASEEDRKTLAAFIDNVKKNVIGVGKVVDVKKSDSGVQAEGTGRHSFGTASNGTRDSGTDAFDPARALEDIAAQTDALAHQMMALGRPAALCAGQCSHATQAGGCHGQHCSLGTVGCFALCEYPGGCGGRKCNGGEGGYACEAQCGEAGGCGGWKCGPGPRCAGSCGAEGRNGCEGLQCGAVGARAASQPRCVAQCAVAGGCGGVKCGPAVLMHKEGAAAEPRCIGQCGYDGAGGCYGEKCGPAVSQAAPGRVMGAGTNGGAGGHGGRAEAHCVGECGYDGAGGCHGEKCGAAVSGTAGSLGGAGRGAGGVAGVAASPAHDGVAFRNAGSHAHSQAGDGSVSCKCCSNKIGVGEVGVRTDHGNNRDTWHPGCFKCAQCDQLLVDMLYFFHSGKYYCGRHFADLHYPRCAGCDELIFAKEYTFAEEQAWHFDHFACFKCDLKLGGHRYVTKDEQPHCLECYNQHYAKTCATCHNKIGPDEKRLSHADANWHATPQCFRCFSCDKDMQQQRFIYKEGRVYCSAQCRQQNIK